MTEVSIWQIRVKPKFSWMDGMKVDDRMIVEAIIRSSHDYQKCKCYYLYSLLHMYMTECDSAIFAYFLRSSGLPSHTLVA